MEKIELTIEEAARLTGKGTEYFMGSENPEDVLKLFSDAMSEKLTRIKNDSAAQSLKNGLDKREKELAKRFKIDSYDNWDDLSEQIANKTSNQSESSSEQAEKISRLNEQIKEYKTQLKQAREETKAIQSDYENRALLSSVKSAAKKHIESLNLNLPSDPEKRERAINRILDLEFNGKSFKKNGSNFSMLDENGDVLTDDKMNDLTVQDIAARAFMDMYTVVEQKQPTNTPPPPNGSPNGMKFSKEDLTPQRYSELANQYKTTGNKEAFDALTKDYQELHYNK